MAGWHSLFISVRSLFFVLPYRHLPLLLFSSYDASVKAMTGAMPIDDSVAWKVWLGSVVSVGLATVAVAARLSARKISAAPFWWDDYTIVISLV